jgi:hypothetical protein
MRWGNDYGDIPRWYWRSYAFQLPRAIEDRRRRRRARAVIAGVLGLIGGL